MNYEEKAKRLEELLAEMEGGRMKLDALIAAYNEGRKLVEECNKELDAIRLIIEKVTGAGVEKVPLSADGDVQL